MDSSRVAPTARQVPRRQVTYALDGYLPRKVISMVAGKRGDGKSLLAIWIASRISTGTRVERDGTVTNGHALGRVWYNTQEDAPDTIVRPRLQAVGANLDQIDLTDWSIKLPDGAGRVRDQVRLRHYDLVIMDSMAMHFENVYFGFRRNRAAMDLMHRLAKEEDCSILFVHHFNKGKMATVEAAIGGQGIIQNMAKAIYVMGQHVDTFGSGTRYFACERINARRPQTLAFDLRTKHVYGYEVPVPYLEFLSTSEAKSWDVFLASKHEEKGSSRMTTVEQAADWLRAYFEKKDFAPQKVTDMEGSAQEAGQWYSAGTFHRARETAGVEKVNAVLLKNILGDAFDWLPPEDCPPKTWWARIPPPAVAE